MLYKPDSTAPAPQADVPLGLAEVDVARQIEALLAEIFAIGQRRLSEADYLAAVLNRTVAGLAAPAGIVWLRAGQGRLAAAQSVGLAAAGVEALAATAAHQQLLAEVVHDGQPTWVLPGYQSGNSLAANASSLLVILAPLDAPSGTRGMLEIFQLPTASPAAQQGYLKFLASVAAAITDYWQRAEQTAALTPQMLWERFDGFVRGAHASLELTPTAFAIANEGRALLDCDRLSVLQITGRRARLLAVSGMDTFDRRADFARGLEQLVRLAAATGDPLWLDDETPLAPQLDAAVQQQLDTSQARTLALVPITVSAVDARSEQLDQRTAPPQLLGMLAIEQFDAGNFDVAFRRRAAAVADHAGIALHNVLTYRRVPLRFVWQALDRVAWLGRARQLPRTLLVLGLLTAAIVALAVVPADFDIVARGQLQPRLRREVFASVDGEVAEISVQHAQHVKAGEAVILLRRPQFDLEDSRINGELQTAIKRLASVQAVRLSSDGSRSETPEKLQQLTAEEEEVKAQLTGLRNQQAVLEGQRRELQLHSPISGEVLTWNVEQTLQSRPVQRGQALLTVADTAGPWQLELKIEDDRVGHVVAARQSLQPELAVSYILATDPEQQFSGTLSRLAMAAETDKTSNTSVLAWVEIQRADLTEARPGAGVSAKIHCGRRAIGYVWFHELWQAVRARLF